MTIRAGIATRYMIRGFSLDTEATVMTAATVTGAVWVVPEAEITKVSGAMTILTDIIGRNMIAALTCSFNAIMAAGTVVFDTGMVK